MEHTPDSAINQTCIHIEHCTCTVFTVASFYILCTVFSRTSIFTHVGDLTLPLPLQRRGFVIMPQSESHHLPPRQLRCTFPISITIACLSLVLSIRKVSSSLKRRARSLSNLSSECPQYERQYDQYHSKKQMFDYISTVAITNHDLGIIFTAHSDCKASQLKTVIIELGTHGNWPIYPIEWTCKRQALRNR
jgi:hypothetical protein